jgi:chemotaxis protein methyltransferase CheR
MGLYFPEERFSELTRGVHFTARKFGFNSAEECIEWLISTPLKRNHIEVLASHLTIGETYFFRETKTFEVLEKYILPELIESVTRLHRPLRIWSAGCCTGEEPYSIAMVLDQLIPGYTNRHAMILATDINPVFLKKAKQGVYREWSFRSISPQMKEKYFQKNEEMLYEIDPRIKNLVNFSYLNLVEDDYPNLVNGTNAMDIIFCRNILMYFTVDQMKKVIQRFWPVIIDGGWLIVGSTETANANFPQYSAVNFPGAILYRKEGEMKCIEDCHKISVQSFQTLPDCAFSLKNRQNRSVPVQDTEAKLYGSGVGNGSAGIYDMQNKEEGKGKRKIQKQADSEEAMKIEELSKTLANCGKLIEALNLCNKAIVLDRLNPRFHFLRALILEEQGVGSEAIKSLKNALYLDPDYILAHFILGNFNRQGGKIRESNRCFRNTLHLLKQYERDDLLPGSDGITAGRLAKLIQVLTGNETIMAS